jgi:hypothetical protein
VGEEERIGQEHEDRGHRRNRAEEAAAPEKHHKAEQTSD